jgi:hypothetical protein
MISAAVAYFNMVWAGTENPLWPHLALIPTSILAGIAVGAGIVLERPKYPEAVQRLGFWLVVVAVAVESVVTVCIFAVDERISNAQQSKIIELETQLSERVLDKKQFDALLSVRGKIKSVNLMPESAIEPTSPPGSPTHCRKLTWTCTFCHLAE